MLFSDILKFLIIPATFKDRKINFYLSVLQQYFTEPMQELHQQVCLRGVIWG